MSVSIQFKPHRVHWSGFDLKVFNSIYLALTSQYFLPIISKNNKGSKEATMKWGPGSVSRYRLLPLW